MKLDFLDHDKLFIDRTNMRHGKKLPDVSDMLPSVRKRGVIVPLVVKPIAAEGRAGIVAGSRRWITNGLVRAEGIDHGPLPCAILENGDDAAAIEASMIENMARLDPDEVTQWISFTRLVKEGRGVEDIASTFGLPELGVRRILALGNLLPRIRDLYARDEIDRATVRHLTMASKSQQKTWLSLRDDPDSYAPVGHQLKAWLFGGQSIAVKHALFDVATYPGQIVTDLFGEDGYFADADAFWTAQQAVIDARRAAYLEAGWSDVVIIPTSEHFHQWDYEKTAKRKGGRIYVDLRANGEASFHEGYLSRKEVQKAARAEATGADAKPARPEITSAGNDYVDLHRHGAVRARLACEPGVALRVAVAHMIAGSPLWTVRIEPQRSPNDAVTESVEACISEAAFDAKRCEMLGILGFHPETRAITGGAEDGLAALFVKLSRLGDAEILAILAVVMGETLDARSVVVDVLGQHLAVDMAPVWRADDALFDLIRDREVLLAIVEEVAGKEVAEANARETGKTLKTILRDHIEGANGRPQVENWVPRWMGFPATSYTPRGGVHAARRSAAVAPLIASDPTAKPGIEPVRDAA